MTKRFFFEMNNNMTINLAIVWYLNNEDNLFPMIHTQIF